MRRIEQSLDEIFNLMRQEEQVQFVGRVLWDSLLSGAFLTKRVFVTPDVWRLHVKDLDESVLARKRDVYVQITQHF